jgi:hypothetical protein
LGGRKKESLGAIRLLGLDLLGRVEFVQGLRELIRNRRRSHLGRLSGNRRNGQDRQAKKNGEPASATPARERRISAPRPTVNVHACTMHRSYFPFRSIF